MLTDTAGPAAFSVQYRPANKDSYSRWVPADGDPMVTGPLFGPDRVADSWTPLECRWRHPEVPKTDVTFLDWGIVLRDEDGDPTLREILSAWGEWLPLAGEAEGYSAWHCTHQTPIDKDASKRTMGTGEADVGKGSIDVFVVDDDDWTPESLSLLNHAGVAWFEADATEPTGLRKHIIESGITGIGLVKCWDPSGGHTFNLLRLARNGQPFPWESR